MKLDLTGRRFGRFKPHGSGVAYLCGDCGSHNVVEEALA